MAAVRAEMGAASEIKWAKATARTLPFYERVLDTFFDNRWPRLSVLTVTKGPNWQVWGRTEEERFFKAYYVFLMRNAGPFSRYNVYLDDKSLQRGYRWSTMHFLVNRARRSEWGLSRRNIRVLKAVDSKGNELIQLADLLLGCATWRSGSEAKTKLRQRFVQRSETAGRRVRVDAFCPKPPNE